MGLLGIKVLASGSLKGNSEIIYSLWQMCLKGQFCRNEEVFYIAYFLLVFGYIHEKEQLIGLVVVRYF